jgi:lipoate-protein ligase B
VNRGGGCVLHLPGQLSGYLVVPLDDGLSLGGYLAILKRVLISVLAEFSLRGWTPKEQPGVFLNRARVASIGVAAGRGVVYHGFTLNVGTYLAPFDLLDEPGLGGWPLRQTSMEAQAQRAIPMERVRESVIRHVEAELGLERRHIYTDHPLIRPKARIHACVAHLG